MGEEIKRRARHVAATDDARGEARRLGEPREQVEPRRFADGHGVEPRARAHAGQARAQRRELAFAHRGLPVAQVHDRAVALRIERAVGRFDHRPEVGGAAASVVGERVEHGTARVLRDALQSRRLAAHGARADVPREHEQPVALGERPRERLGQRLPELERGRIHRGRVIDHEHEVDAFIPGLARVGIGRAHRDAEVAAAVGRGARLRAGGGVHAHARPVARRSAAQVEHEVRGGDHVAARERHVGVVAARTGARANLGRARAREVEVGAKLADTGSERGQREAVGAPAVGARGEPLGVGHEHAACHRGRDRVEPRVIASGRVPFEQRRVVRRALVDLLLIRARGGLTLAHEAVDQHAVAVDGEALQHRAARHAQRVEALDRVRRRVEEGLFELGHREVAHHAHARVEALHHQRPARRSGLAWAARGHGAEAHRARDARGLGELVGHRARPVVEERTRRGVRFARVQHRVLARVHGAAT